MSERAWAAGFFDGEGSVYHYTYSCRKYRYPRITATIGQCHKAPLIRFQKAVGVGTIAGPYPSSHKNGKPYWQWHANTLHDVLIVRKKLTKYLCQVKKTQFAKKVGEYERARRKRFPA